MKSAELLEKKDPRDATVAYLANWNHVVFASARNHAQINPAAALIPLEVLPPPSTKSDLEALAVVSGVAGGVILLAAIGDSAADAMHEDRVSAAESITTRTMRKIYERDGSEYSQTMLAPLRRVNFRRGETYDAFAAVHDQMIAQLEPMPAVENGDHPHQMDASEMDLAAPAYRPTGKGPVPYQTSDGWKVVEAGQDVEIATHGGDVWKGKITALSTKGDLLRR